MEARKKEKDNSISVCVCVCVCVYFGWGEGTDKSSQLYAIMVSGSKKEGKQHVCGWGWIAKLVKVHNSAFYCHQFTGHLLWHINGRVEEVNKEQYISYQL